MYSIQVSKWVLLGAAGSLSLQNLTPARQPTLSTRTLLQVLPRYFLNLLHLLHLWEFLNQAPIKQSCAQG